MIPEIGHFALILALAMALVQAAAAPLGARLRDGGLMALARPAAVAQFVFISAALACLMQAFVVSDFSVVTVADNSHSAKPLLYKFTGTGAITRAPCCSGCGFWRSTAPPWRSSGATCRRRSGPGCWPCRR